MPTPTLSMDATTTAAWSTYIRLEHVLQGYMSSAYSCPQHSHSCFLASSAAGSSSFAVPAFALLVGVPELDPEFDLEGVLRSWTGESKSSVGVPQLCARLEVDADVSESDSDEADVDESSVLQRCWTCAWRRQQSFELRASGCERGWSRGVYTRQCD